MRILFGDCALDRDRRELSCGGVSVHLQPQVFDLLLYLIDKRERVVSKEELLSAVWHGRMVSESTLSSRINAARSAIGDSGERQQLIRTVARRGLRFVGEVMQEPAPAETPVPLASDDRPTIAVLPFANMSGDPMQDYFSDGITDDIITDLSRWRQLSVRSRSASFRFRGPAADIGRIARELDVRYIVQGSVRRQRERIRISAHLIDTETGSHVWADRFDQAGVFEIQDELVRTIVGTLAGRVQEANVARAQRKPPANLGAYDLVLQANALPWSEPRSAAKAISLLQQAIELDPAYGYAHALLGIMRCDQWRDDLGGSDATLDEAWRLARRAVALSGNDSTCFAVLGQVCLQRRAFDLALQHAERAVEINPTNQWNAAGMGLVLSYAGSAEEAIVWFGRALEIDPYFDTPWYRPAIGRALMFLRRYEPALAEFERSPPRSYRVAACMASCYARLGALSRARALAAICLEWKPDFTIARWTAREPFKDAADAEHLVESLRLAGLPE